MPSATFGGHAEKVDAFLQILLLVELVTLVIASVLAGMMAALLFLVWVLSAVTGAAWEEYRQGW